MAFPRLLFVNEKTDVSSDVSVINDLKLDLIFSPEVSDYLLLAPEKETLIARREMFSALLADSEAEDKLSRLTSLLTETEELYRAVTTAVSEKTAAFVFVSLVAKLSLFCEETKAFSFFINS